MSWENHPSRDKIEKTNVRDNFISRVATNLRKVRFWAIICFMLLLGVCLFFSYNCNLFKHFFMYMLYVELLCVFNLNCIYLHVTLMVCFKANFLLQENKILSYFLKEKGLHSI